MTRTTLREILLEKHREETANYQVDMDSYLDDGENLMGTPTVIVEKEDSDGAWQGTGSEFTVSNKSIATSSAGRANAAVKFTIAKAAESSHQPKGKNYRVKVTASTDGGQERVSDNPLWISD